MECTPPCNRSPSFGVSSACGVACDFSHHCDRRTMIDELIDKFCAAPNHGRVFKSFLHAYLPDWRDREWRLREEVGSNP